MRKKDDSFKQLETMAVLSLACLIFGVILKTTLLVYGAAVLLFTGIFLKRVSQKISWAWLKLAAFLGTINTKILLSLIFYLALTPLAWMYRVFKGDTLHIGKKDDVISYWSEHERVYSPKDFEKMW